MNETTGSRCWRYEQNGATVDVTLSPDETRDRKQYLLQCQRMLSIAFTVIEKQIFLETKGGKVLTVNELRRELRKRGWNRRVDSWCHATRPACSLKEAAEQEGLLCAELV
jgi:hypothetical protein